MLNASQKSGTLEYKPSKLTSGERLRNHRSRAGLSQTELGQATGYTASAIGTWECEVSIPRPGSLQKLIGVLLKFAAFAPGQELREARQLWLGFKAHFDNQYANSRYPDFPHTWFWTLLINFNFNQKQQASDERRLVVAVATPTVKLQLVQLLETKTGLSPELTSLLHNGADLLLVARPLELTPKAASSKALLIMDCMAQQEALTQAALKETIASEDSIKNLLSKWYPITTNQIKVLKLLVAGQFPAQIDQTLGLHSGGCRRILARILRFLEVFTLNQALVKINEGNLIAKLEDAHAAQKQHTAAESARQTKRLNIKISKLELSILRLYAEGCPLEELAYRLYATPFAFPRRLKSVLDALNTATLNEAVNKAIEMGLLKSSDASNRTATALAANVNWAIQEKVIAGRVGEEDWTSYRLCKLINGTPLNPNSKIYKPIGATR